MVALAVTGWPAVTQAEPTAIPTPTPTPLTNAQQACVNEMNKNGEKVNKAQLRENERCLMDFQKWNGLIRRGHVFDTCITADRKGKVLKATGTTETQEGKKCDPLVVPPPFAYTDSATVNAAAVNGALALTYKIFGGPPVHDNSLFTKARDPKAAECQIEVLKRAGKLENTVLKELIKAKKLALKNETVGNGSVLAVKLAAVFSSNVRIERARDTLLSGVDRNCAALRVPPGEIFAGDCGEWNPNLRGVEFCAIVAAHCAACAMINAFDDLNLDCDQLDDQVANGSCGGFESVSPLTNSDCFPSSVPDSASEIAKLCIALANSAPNMVFTPADYQSMPEDCKPLVNPICR